MKLLHAADLHLDSPMLGFSESQRTALKKSMLQIPEQLAHLARLHACDLMLLSGDLFDGSPSGSGIAALRNALEDVGIPVLITPGNHDFVSPDSPWITESWPKNVHIFTKPVLEPLSFPELDCRIYGAGFSGMDCPGLLAHFRADGPERYHIGIVHGDPIQPASPYNPITTAQVRDSGLHYLALGHIHQWGSFQAGTTLCAWPGCPMGRGYDETGEKGILLVTLDSQATAEFLPLDTPRFYDWEVHATEGFEHAASRLLPPVGNHNFYRMTFTGYAPEPYPDRLSRSFPQFPNLTFRDRTVPETDLWASAQDDSLEGLFFRKLKVSMEGQDETSQRIVRLAAEISRKLLDGQEVTLP